MASAERELIEKYRDALVALERAQVVGRPDVVNRLIDRAQGYHLLLRETAEGRAAVSSLIDDDVAAVRRWSATNALTWDEERARHALATWAARGGPGDEDELDAYERIEATIDAAAGTTARHQLLGFATGVQNPVLEDVAASFHAAGVAGLVDATETPRDWRLLLQVDSDDDVGLSWGGSDVRLAFAARDRDLRQPRVGITWLNRQW